MTATIFFLLGMACLISALWLLRSLIFGNVGFCAFMIWNLFLGAVPVLSIPLFPIVTTHVEGALQLVVLTTLGLMWLLFLPNAFYLLTDFMHLNPNVVVTKRNKGFSISVHHERGDALFVLDGLLIMLSVIIGALFGGVALHTLFQFLENNYFATRFYVLGIVILLSALGIFIGRYNRWNSWDAITRPHIVIQDTCKSLVASQQRSNLIITIATMVFFQILSLIIIANY